MSTDHAANLALFLLANKGSVCATWRGRMSAAAQRNLFGRFLGKGLLEINGAEEMLSHTVKVCFGLDYNTTHEINWRSL